MPNPSPAESNSFQPGARVRAVSGIYAGYDGRIMTRLEAKQHKMVAQLPGDANRMEHIMLSLFGHDVPLHIRTKEIVLA